MDKFIQFTRDDDHDERLEWLFKHPLAFAIFTVCAMRARRTLFSEVNNLEVREFYISPMECWRFGLKWSQKGKIERVLKKLIKLKLIQQVESKTGIKKCLVYRLIDDRIFDINPENREQNGNQTDTEQGTNREKTRTNNNGKNGNKEKNENKNKEGVVADAATTPIISGFPFKEDDLAWYGSWRIILRTCKGRLTIAFIICSYLFELEFNPPEAQFEELYVHNIPYACVLKGRRWKRDFYPWFFRYVTEVLGVQLTSNPPNLKDVLVHIGSFERDIENQTIKIDRHTLPLDYKRDEYAD